MRNAPKKSEQIALKIMIKTPRLILASKSPARIKMLQDIGLTFEAVPAEIDERTIEKSLVGETSEKIATVLAQEKARAISRLHPDAYVLGSDQVLDFQGKRLHKAKTPDEAKEKLLHLAGQTL